MYIQIFSTNLSLFQHELVVVAEAGVDLAHARVQVRVRDVNDNPPYFLNPRPHVTLVEEEESSLPATIITVRERERERE